MLWDKNWLGSAFALNFAKNIIASTFYFITLSATGAVPSFNPGDASTVAFPFLALSAFLGVVIGDCTAIASLQRLGARRYLLIDCLKPALAQLLGVLFFSEKVTYRLAAGIAAVISGVYIASASKVPAVTADMAPDVSTKNSKRLALGYALAVGHLIFDTAGVSITKAHSNGLGPLSIGLLRFGSAALMLGTIGAVAQGWASAVRSKPTSAAPSASKGRGVVEGSWWQLPANMSASNWKNIVFGTFFVTFIGPALFMRSVLLMPLGLAVTLSCTAPLYEPLLARVLRGVRAELQAVLGAALACVGVAVLCV
jgi:drug/metabolite transporter (DMT)-like permease